MFGIQSPFVNRLILGKSLGFIIGLIGFTVLTFMTDASMMLRIWILFWYLTFGVFIGFIGIMNKHPLFPINLPFWFRGIFFGAWLNLVIVLLAYPVIAPIFTQFTNVWIPVFSPFFLVLEWAIIWLLLEFICTKYAGEGETMFAQPKKEEKKKKFFGMF